MDRIAVDPRVHFGKPCVAGDRLPPQLLNTRNERRTSRLEGRHMMRILLSAHCAVLLGSGVAVACDDHVGKCKVEAWRANSAMNMLMIEGSATCDSGMATIRLYDGEKFLGVAQDAVEGHALNAMATNIPAHKPLSIKYSIRP